MNKIQFSIVYLNEDHVIQTYAGEYRNLKDLIQDQFYPEDFGQCVGMGRCATCMVEVIGAQPYQRPLNRNEETTLSRSLNRGSARLSCQMEIDDDLANQRIRVLDFV